MSIFELTIGWLAPPSCIGCGEEGELLCEPCIQSDILPYGERCFLCGAISIRCRTCKKCRQSSPRHVWVATDYAGAAKELLKTYKFGHTRQAARPLSRLMADELQQFNSDTDIDGANYLVVPVPTASSRVRARGFDHSYLLAKGLASQLNLKYSPALGRLGQARQVGAKRAERIKQQTAQYFLRRPVQGQNILLVDDVVTTGATLRSATKTLRAAGAKKVDALVFAKSI